MQKIAFKKFQLFLLYAILLYFVVYNLIYEKSQKSLNYIILQNILTFRKMLKNIIFLVPEKIYKNIYR